jgi:hypothetical protein
MLYRSTPRRPEPPDAACSCPTDAFSRTSIHASCGDADLDVKVLHIAKATFDQPVNRCLGDIGHELCHPRLSELGAEQDVDVRLGLERDGARKQVGSDWMRWSYRNQAGEIQSTWGRLAVEGDGCESADAQNGTPQDIHARALAVLQDASAEEAIAVYG